MKSKAKKENKEQREWRTLKVKKKGIYTKEEEK